MTTERIGRVDHGARGLRALVLQTIRELIVSGEFQERIFSENELIDLLSAEPYNLSISRTPVREALAILVNEDLIEQLPQRGLRVRSSATPDEKVELIRLRLELERLIVEQLAGRDGSVGFERASDLVEEMRAAARRKNRREFAKADAAFQTELAELAGFRVGASFLRNLRDKLDMIEPGGLAERRSLSEVLGEREELLNTIRSGRTERASKICEQHCEATARRLGVQVELARAS